MGEIKTFFFDTYAFYEIIQGNENYKPYEKEVSIITTKLNLMELHYGLLSLYGKEEADKYFDNFSQFCVEITDDIIKESNEFRNNNKKKKMSYIDCLGYICARRHGVLFLTGDKEFHDLDNVEFVK